MKLTFSKFEKKDFADYKSWYKDADLNKRLGPMDDDWLKHALDRSDGCEYSVFLEEELVAVVGILFPTSEYPAYYITDFAIRPGLRNKGIGSQVLKQLIALHNESHEKSWIAFIDTRNPKAKSFFEKNDWVCKSDKPDKDGMLKLEYKANSTSYNSAYPVRRGSI